MIQYSSTKVKHGRVVFASTNRSRSATAYIDEESVPASRQAVDMPSDQKASSAQNDIEALAPTVELLCICCGEIRLVGRDWEVRRDSHVGASSRRISSTPAPRIIRSRSLQQKYIRASILS